MYIRVLFHEISPIQYEAVCNHYNQYKPNDWSSLYPLNRCEGGFATQSEQKQLRWSRKCLIPPVPMKNFTNQEITLLYESICTIFGVDQVILHPELFPVIH